MDPGLHLHHGERLGGELELPGEREPAVWTAPRTWVAGEVLTASLLNTHLRDQLLWLGGTDSRLAAPPGAPIDGQVWRYVADATAGVEWTTVYNAADASASKWHVLGGGAALYSEVTTLENSVVTAYGVLTTPGPSVVLPRAGDYDTEHGFTQDNLNGDAVVSPMMSYDIGGTGAVDADAVRSQTGQHSTAATHTFGSVSRIRRKAGLAAVTLTAKYRLTNAGTGRLQDRFLAARPVRIA